MGRDMEALEWWRALLRWRRPMAACQVARTRWRSPEIEEEEGRLWLEARFEGKGWR